MTDYHKKVAVNLVGSKKRSIFAYHFVRLPRSWDITRLINLTNLTCIPSDIQPEGIIFYTCAHLRRRAGAHRSPNGFGRPSADKDMPPQDAIGSGTPWPDRGRQYLHPTSLCCRTRTAPATNSGTGRLPANSSAAGRHSGNTIRDLYIQQAYGRSITATASVISGPFSRKRTKRTTPDKICIRQRSAADSLSTRQVSAAVCALHR